MQKQLLTILSVVIGFSVQFVNAQTNASKPIHSSINYQLADSIKVIQYYSEYQLSSSTQQVSFASNSSLTAFNFYRKKAGEYIIRFNITDSNTANQILLTKGLHTIDSSNNILFAYNWNDTATIKTLTTLIIDSAATATYCTGYVFLPKEKQWKLLAAYKIKGIINYITQSGLVLFSNETKKNLDKKIIQQVSWIQRENGSWKELPEIYFYSNNKTVEDISQSFAATHVRPVIDVTKNIDSAEQYMIDITTIKKAVADKKIDTAGSVNGVYYKILKEGNGENVTSSDTVTVFYKGSLLSDGSVFDETKNEKPATFPLKRLIKGWQEGLAKCKVGGSIRLIIPSALGYSIRSRSKAIPPNSILVFDIEVLGVKHAK